MVLDRARAGRSAGPARSDARPRHGTQLVQAYGLREIATGIGILSLDQPAAWIWGRVGGDALDMATLATGLQPDNPKKENVEMALAAVAGVAALDVVCGASLARHARPKPRWRLTAIDYGRRSGFPKPAEQMRGAARDFEVPRDMRTPEALRPFITDRSSAGLHRS
jgi:hypothetical protein